MSTTSAPAAAPEAEITSALEKVTLTETPSTAPATSKPSSTPTPDDEADLWSDDEDSQLPERPNEDVPFDAAHCYRAVYKCCQCSKEWFKYGSLDDFEKNHAPLNEGLKKRCTQDVNACRHKHCKKCRVCVEERMVMCSDIDCAFAWTLNEQIQANQKECEMCGRKITDKMLKENEDWIPMECMSKEDLFLWEKGAFGCDCSEADKKKYDGCVLDRDRTKNLDPRDKFKGISKSDMRRVMMDYLNGEGDEPYFTDSDIDQMYDDGTGM